VRRLKLGLAALLLAGMAHPALAQGAFDDARQNLVAGDVDSVLLSITMGAISVNMQDEQGYTLLHYAAQNGSLNAVRALLDRGADPTIRAKNGSTSEALATTPEVRAELKAATAASSNEGSVTPPK
jgi:ankyrin repeat protein